MVSEHPVTELPVSPHDLMSRSSWFVGKTPMRTRTGPEVKANTFFLVSWPRKMNRRNCRSENTVKILKKIQYNSNVTIREGRLEQLITHLYIHTQDEIRRLS